MPGLCRCVPTVLTGPEMLRNPGSIAFSRCGCLPPESARRSASPQVWRRQVIRHLQNAGSDRYAEPPRGRRPGAEGRRSGREKKRKGEEAEGRRSGREREEEKVGMTGVEPATSASRTQRSTKLSYIPRYGAPPDGSLDRRSGRRGSDSQSRKPLRPRIRQASADDLLTE